MLKTFRKFGFLISALLFLSVLFLNPSASAQSQRPLPAASTGYVPGEVIVKLKSPSEGSLQKDYQLTSLEKILKQHKLKDKGLDRLILVKQKDADVSQLVDKLKKDPRVEYAEPNFILKTTLIPNDPNFTNLWGLQNSGQTGGANDADIDAPEAWDITRDTNLVVGIIDTGVDYTHEDLQNNMWTNQAEASGSAGVDDDGNGFIDDIYGYDFVNNDPDPIDDYGHGTHVAGTIAAKGGNGLGVTGVNWSGKIAALKVLDSSGYGSTAAAINALTYANQMGFKITSNSWGGAPYSQALSDIISAANNLGYLFITSAGNNSVNTDAHPNYPSSYNLPNIISVSATDHNDQLAAFSNWGPTSVSLGAPGVNILSTVPKASCSLCDPSGYRYLNGTSMAAPHISGVAALLWSYLPNLNHLEIKDRILNTVNQVKSLNYKVVSHGRLNLFNALSNLTLPPPPPLNKVVLFDNFEASSSSWVIAGNVGTGSTAPASSLWHLSQRRSQSPQTAWYYGQESSGNYDTGSPNWGTLTSPDIDLTNNQSSTLTFYNFLSTENLSSNGNPFYDEASVKVSTDGVNWTKVQSYGGSGGAWVKETVDLSSFDGQVIKIQFFFDTKDAISNNLEGWFIDDVSVLGISAATYPVTGTVFVDSNKNGLQEVGESGYKDASVSTGIKSITTGSAGQYTLDLPSGNHNIFLTPPTGYSVSTLNPISVTLPPPATANFALIDNIAPQVNLTFPTQGATVSGSLVITADASDAGSGISRVIFHVNGSYVCQDNTKPYTCNWTVPQGAGINYTLTAWGIDQFNNKKSHSITVTSAGAPSPTPTPTPTPTATPTPTPSPTPTPTPAPSPTPTPPSTALSITITNPANGSQVSGSQVISADATPGVNGINRVVFHVNGNYLCTDYSSPYSCNWTVPAGSGISYAIKGWVIDNVNFKASSSVSVTSQ